MILGQHNMNIQPAYLQVRKNVRSIWPNSVFYIFFHSSKKGLHNSHTAACVTFPTKKNLFPTDKIGFGGFLWHFSKGQF